MAKTCKYKKMRRYVSYDSGNTWAATSTYVKGDLIERNSPSCSGGTDVIVWRQIPITEDYVCNGANKHYKERKYVNGVATQETRTGQLYEYLSADCGGSDVPSGVKWIATLSDGTTTSASCNSNTITQGEIPRTAVTLRIGTCVTKIDRYAMEMRYYNLKAVSLPRTLKSIGDFAFSRSAIQSIVIPNGLTYLGTYAFGGCASLRSISVPSGITQVGNPDDGCAGSFQNCTAVTSLNIAEGTTDIACQEFSGLESLPTLRLPSTLRTIGMNAFMNARSLTSVTIPNSVTTIASGAFTGAYNIRWIDIGSGVTSIGASAFRLNGDEDDIIKIQYIRVRATTPPTIEAGAFALTNNCPIYVPCESKEAYKTAWSVYEDRIACSGDTPTPTVYTKWEADPISEGYVCDGTTKCYRERKYTSTDNVNWTRTDETRKGDVYETDSMDCGGSSVPQGVKWIATKPNGSTTSASCNSNTIVSGEVPSNIVKVKIGSCVTHIGYVAFDTYSGLTEVNIPSSVIDIRDWGFYKCSSLPSIRIPGSVTSIGRYAFAWCSSLTAVTIPDSVTRIGDSAFVVCSGLTSITIPSGVTSIENDTFGSCESLTSITIPSGVTSIGNDAFGGCQKLRSINIPNGVTNIGHHAFWDCRGLTSITIPSGVTSIEKGAFGYCNSLTSVTIPSGVTSFGNMAFEGCDDLTSITIPSRVTSIGERALFGCIRLPSVTIPSGVTSIGEAAFYNCKNLQSVTVLATTPPTIGSDVFADTNNCPIYVPAASVGAYKTAWSTYSSRIQTIQ